MGGSGWCKRGIAGTNREISWYAVLYVTKGSRAPCSLREAEMNLYTRAAILACLCLYRRCWLKQ